MNPWKTVIGSDSPRFACYTDGLMIFYSREREAYQFIRLGQGELADLRSMMSAFDGLKDHYDLSGGRTDQPVNRMGFRRGGKLRWVSAEGGMIPEMNVIVAWLERLARFAGTERIREWTPAYLEVMLWPFDHARSELPWPEEFPGLDSPLTVARRKDAYSIYLPWSEKEKLKRFGKELDGRAVLLDGRKWSVDTRIPFPHELPANLASAPSAPPEPPSAERAPVFRPLRGEIRIVTDPRLGPQTPAATIFVPEGWKYGQEVMWKKALGRRAPSQKEALYADPAQLTFRVSSPDGGATFYYASSERYFADPRINFQTIPREYHGLNWGEPMGAREYAQKMALRFGCSRLELLKSEEPSALKEAGRKAAAALGAYFDLALMKYACAFRGKDHELWILAPILTWSSGQSAVIWQAGPVVALISARAGEFAEYLPELSTILANSGVVPDWARTVWQTAAQAIRQDAPETPVGGVAMTGVPPFWPPVFTAALAGEQAAGYDALLRLPQDWAGLLTPMARCGDKAMAYPAAYARAWQRADALSLSVDAAFDPNSGQEKVWKECSTERQEPKS
jgi:hypothetical protein